VNKIWLMTTDGVHSWFHETAHPELSINTEYFSHKYNKAGLSYELGILLHECRLIWMRGPFPAGWSDRKSFKHEGGLQAKLRETGTKSIADGGYHAEEDFDILSTPNNMDTDAVKKFKRRALKRHEKFNGLMKTFKCLDDRFRNSEQRFKNCFEAVAVICQYAIQCDKPLYNVLVDRM
jgi:DDE superfamily endonuclease